MSVVVLLAYILSDMDLFSRLGLILLAIGASYPSIKLPGYVRRAKQCQRYQEKLPEKKF